MQPGGRDPHDSHDTAGRQGLDVRDRAANQRETAADVRDRIANQREWSADERDRIADERERIADEREAWVDELLRAHGVDVNDLQQRAEEAAARSAAKIARSQEQTGRAAAASQRDRDTVERELAQTRQVHADIGRRRRAAIAQTHAIIAHAQSLRRGTAQPAADTQA